MKRAVIVSAVAVVVLALVGMFGFKLVHSRTVQVTGSLVYRVTTDEKVVALTFDDGPTAKDADVVLAALAERKVSATFYVNGESVGDGAVVRRLVAGGHEIGNHTWDHRGMVFVSPSTVADEIESTDRAIGGSGYTGPLTFRPPYGKKVITLPVYLDRHDRQTVTWDVSAEDFTTTTQTTQQIVDATVATTQPGSIILLHPWFGRTATQRAIGPIIDELQAGGTDSKRSPS